MTKMRFELPAGSAAERLLSALGEAAAPATTARFYTRGSTVFFRNTDLLFLGDPPADAPEVTLLEAWPIEGDRNALTAETVAEGLCDLLNQVATWRLGRDSLEGD